MSAALKAIPSAKHLPFFGLVSWTQTVSRNNALPEKQMRKQGWHLQSRGQTKELLWVGALECAEWRAENLRGKKQVSFSNVWKIVPPPGSPGEKEKKKPTKPTTKVAISFD